MRLATFNLLHGRSLEDGLVDLDRLHTSVAGLDADVLGIQEVDRDQERSHGADLTAVVAEGMEAVDHRFLPAISGTPGFEWEPAGEVVTGPAYGIGLVSRVPVKEWHQLTLAAAPVRSPIMIPGSKQVIWLKDEPRVALAAVLDGVTVATTHLSFVPAWNVIQLRKVVTWLATLPGPHVLLGDLNMPLPVATLTSRWTSLITAKTFPSPAPRLQLDAILASSPMTVRDGRAERLALSDHLALSVDL